MGKIKNLLPDEPEEGGACPEAECPGTLTEEHEGDGCSCHISPPCGYCTNAYYYCHTCGWDERDYQ